MGRSRDVFLQMAEAVAALIASPEVGNHWDEPSALRHFSVRGLTGHLARATKGVESYLDRGEATGEPASPADYYVAVMQNDDIDSAFHQDIRDRAEANAAKGQAALVEEVREVTERLRTRFEREPPERLVAVFGDVVMRLDDYLVTRVLEQVVHVDDLAVSVGVPTPRLPPEALELAIDNALALARRRHGDLAVLRAMTRRERDDVDALHVF